MSKLSPEKRKMMSKALFAGPNRSFPVEDKNHAKAALLDVGKDKHLDAAQKNTVRARARAELAK